jgi:glycosyltransferase involved in cell wall biosynthesis
VKIFGSLFPFVETGDESLRMGRFVANYEFLTALLNYSHFDSFHLYCLTPGHFNDTLQRLSGDSSISEESKARVQLFLFDTMEENLESIEYHCFHLGGWGYFWAGTVALRNRCAISPFPVTGIIHSLNSTNTIVDAHKLVHAPHQSCDAVICTSESGKEVLKKAIAIAETDNVSYSGDLATIPLGYDSVFNTKIDKREARETLGIGQDDMVILYLGRLSPSSKADLYPLLQVIKTLRARHGSSLKLILAGGVKGSELRLHKDMIVDLGLDSSVRLMINFESEQKPSIYAAADIFVAPSDNIQETFGISIIEAMASGLPVVASDMDGYRELVQHEVTGLKVPTIWNSEHSLETLHEMLDPGSLQLLLAQSMVVVPAKLEYSLERLIRDSSLRERMGRAGAEIAQSTYRWEQVIAQYEKLWDGLKEKAISEPRNRVSSTQYDPQLSHLFSHYTTTLFSEQMKIAIRPVGTKIIETGELPAIYSEMSLVLDNEIIADVLKSCSEAIIPVTSLLHFRHKKCQTTLLWMAKYDLIELISHE